MRHQDNRPEMTTNRLSSEQSPYLLQHATNPVDWFPFGDEAFEKARLEDKPVFLSVGYATCHWCHVMEQESFEDEEVAALMNDTFVSVKVDREERPDIDHIYMTVCQMMTGSGGWPLTVLLTPDRKPFLCTTYLPKHTRYGKKGMLDVVPDVRRLWRSDRARVEETADRITETLVALSSPPTDDTPGEESLHRAFRELSNNFDSEHGGFGRGMKFPTPHQLLFLLRYHERYESEPARHMATRTLDAMMNGGIYDHVGFGFHRYTTDAKWEIPHFEKMLYDQALLLSVYAEAATLTENSAYARVAEEIAIYVLRNMTHPEGGFYSAEDADSEGIEGKYYLWTKDGLRQALDSRRFSTIKACFDLSVEGNFADESGIEGATVLKRRPAAADAPRELDAALRLLREARSKRVPPLKDDKILTDWNGLMIGALALFGRLSKKPFYIEAARKSFAFIERHLLDRDGLQHRFRIAHAGLPAHLDDHAFLAWGAFMLYQATQDISFLERTLSLSERMIAGFADKNGGGFFHSAESAEPVIVRLKEFYDGAIPSGNAVAFDVLVKTARITGRTDFDNAAREISTGVAPTLKRNASAHTMFLTALDGAMRPSAEVFIVGDSNSTETQRLLEASTAKYIPHLLVVHKTSENGQRLADIAPHTAHLSMISQRPTAYVCVDQSCSRPTSNPEEVMESIEKAMATPPAG